MSLRFRCFKRILICLKKKNREERKNERGNKKRNPEDKVNLGKETNAMWKLSKKGKKEDRKAKEKDREFVKNKGGNKSRSRGIKVRVLFEKKNSTF